MAFTAADVKKLREMTDCGMMECKKALTEADGDMDKADELELGGGGWGGEPGEERGHVVGMAREDQMAAALEAHEDRLQEEDAEGYGGGREDGVEDEEGAGKVVQLQCIKEAEETGEGEHS